MAGTYAPRLYTLCIHIHRDTRHFTLVVAKIGFGRTFALLSMCENDTGVFWLTLDDCSAIFFWSSSSLWRLLVGVEDVVGDKASFFILQKNSLRRCQNIWSMKKERQAQNSVYKYMHTPTLSTLFSHSLFLYTTSPLRETDMWPTPAFIPSAVSLSVQMPPALAMKTIPWLRNCTLFAMHALSIEARQRWALYIS